MSSSNPGIHESFEEQDIISNLIETARGLVANDIGQSKEFFQKALTLSRNVKFQSGMGDCYFELARIHVLQKNYEAAISSFMDAAASYSQAHNYKGAFDSTFALAEAYLNYGSYDLACEAYYDSLEISGKVKDPECAGLVLNKLGDTSRLTGNYDKAISYHTQALRIFEETGNRKMQAETCYLLGNCMNWANRIDLAYEQLDKSLNIAVAEGDPELQIKPTGSMAILFTKMKEYEKAETYFYKAIDLSGITQDAVLKADLLKNLGQLYIAIDRYDDALDILNRSLQAIKDSGAKYPINQIHKSIADAYEKKGDPIKALDHYKKHASLANELLNEEIAVKTRSLQFKHDFEKIMKEKQVAEAAVKLKDQFISNLSHEIRTPLNGVLGMTSLLSDTNPTPEQSEYINTIRLSANNLIETVDNILDFSKIQQGEISINAKEFHLRELVSSVVQLLKVRADEKGIGISLRFDEHLPNKVSGDDYRLHQVLRNILSNAIKYTEKGSIQVDVNVTEVKGNEVKIIFSITDSGIGIPDTKLPHIFDIYSNPGTVDSKIPEGTGVGLAIARQLTELQGGTISVNSTVGTGSVFKIELPFKTTEPLKKNLQGSKNSTPIDLKDLSDVVILLVEDNKVNQFLAQKLLGKMGFKVEIANNGREAIEFLRIKEFNLILMDVQMPEMNGYELTQTIRTSLPNPVNQIPVIALTAYASVQEKEKALALGMSDYITKPYSPHELLTAVMRQISKAKENAHKDNVLITHEMIRQSSNKMLHLFSDNKEDVISLFQMLASQIPAITDEISKHIEAQNWQATFQAVHRLKSSVQLLKIGSLIDRINELEEWTRDEIQKDRITRTFDSFKKDCELTTSLLKEEIIRLKNSKS